MDPEPLTPAQRVARLIEKLDITPYQFGKETGLSHQTISNVLAGKSKPSMDTLEAIAKRYPGCVTFMLTGKGEPFEARETGLPIRLDKPEDLKPATPVEAPATQPAKGTATPMMMVIDESGELKAVKDERDFLREQVKTLLNIIRGKQGPQSQATGTDSDFKPGDLSQAASEEPQPQFMYVQMVGPAPEPAVQVHGLRRYDSDFADILEEEDSEEVTHLRIAS